MIWQPMRVKTPWIDALKESREARVSGNIPMPTTVKLDLTPKKIQESSYKAVCLLNSLLSLLLLLPRFSEKRTSLD